MEETGFPAMRGVRSLSRTAALGFLVALACAQAADAADAVALGQGRYYTQPKDGLLSAAAPAPLEARFLSGERAGKAVPTNQWYSSVIFGFPSEPIHAHPMTYRTGEGGFEIGLAARQVVPTNRGNNEIRYPHVADISVSPGSGKVTGATLVGISDWLARIRLGTGNGDWLQASVLHGSPFSYYESGTADVRFTLAATATVIADAGDGRTMAFALGGKTYAIFAPAGSTWTWTRPTELVVHLPAASRFFSVAGLPDGNAATIGDFTAVAYAFPTQTTVQWQYDQARSVLRATYRVETVAREGTNTETLMGLYPHQWYGQKIESQLRQGYDSVRGRIRLLRGNAFTLERVYHGFVPYWGSIRGAEGRDAVHSLLGGDTAKSRQIFTRMQGHGTYWTGKGLGALANLMSVAEVEGDLDKRDKLLEQMEDRMQSWFDGEHAGYFVQDPRIGSFLGYPQEFNSVRNMNDHHFHYGYWVMAAAHVALRDPAWISNDKWGGMVGRIVADIATPERGRSDFPFLRNFDAYEGHSWASGDAAFSEGNNQESSSEAVNAWAGLILLGEATSNAALRDLGIFLYTSEIESVEHYWFDMHQVVFPPEFGKPFTAQVFGGKYAYNTWWTEEPRQILGINLLPMTTASLYLGADPAYVRRCVDALPGEKAAYEKRGMSDGTPEDIWQDVIASYLALADPQAGAQLWDPHGSIEVGETRSHTQHWLWSLREMGPPDFGVTADTPLYAVFRKADGARTYLAFNAGKSPVKVSFSDGKTLDVAPGKLARLP